MKALLKNKSIIKILTSNAITRYGDSVETLIFSWIVYELTGSLSIMGIVFMINFIPNLIFSPFAGVYADRHNRKRIIIISDIVRGINAIVIAVMLLVGHISVALIICFSIINSTFESFASPARYAFSVDIVPEELFMQFTGLNTSVRSFSELIGLATAGMLVLVGGNGTAILIDGITFFMSALGISLITYKYISANQVSTGVKSYFQDISNGFKFVISKQILIIIMFCSFILNFLFTPINILMPAYADTTLSLGINGLSIMESSLVVGLILGGLLITKLNNVKNLSSISVAGFFLMAFTYLLFALIPGFNFSNNINIICIAVNSALFGATVPIISSPMMKRMFTLIPDNKRGITSALISVTGLVSMPLGGGIIGLIGDSISVTKFFMIASTGLIILSIFLLFNKNFHYNNTELAETEN